MNTNSEPTRILVVDDSELNHAILTRFLERWGCEVSCASNGKEAVEMSARSDYQLVIMDCNMPIMDGLAATGAIRRREADSETRVPIVALTGSSRESDRERCFEAGMDDYYAKPIDGDGLYSLVSKYAWKTDSPLDRATQTGES